MFHRASWDRSIRASWFTDWGTPAGVLKVPVKSKGKRDVESVHDGEAHAVGEAQAGIIRS
jgi:hypothetical protein